MTEHLSVTPCGPDAFDVSWTKNGGQWHTHTMSRRLLAMLRDAASLALDDDFADDIRRQKDAIRTAMVVEP